MFVDNEFRTRYLAADIENLLVPRAAYFRIQILGNLTVVILDLLCIVQLFAWKIIWNPHPANNKGNFYFDFARDFIRCKKCKISSHFVGVKKSESLNVCWQFMNVIMRWQEDQFVSTFYYQHVTFYGVQICLRSFLMAFVDWNKIFRFYGLKNFFFGAKWGKIFFKPIPSSWNYETG